MSGERLARLAQHVLSKLEEAHAVPIVPGGSGGGGGVPRSAAEPRGVHGDLRSPNVMIKLPLQPPAGAASAGGASQGANTAAVAAVPPSACGPDVDSAADGDSSLGREQDPELWGVMFIDFDVSDRQERVYVGGTLRLDVLFGKGGGGHTSCR